MRTLFLIVFSVFAFTVFAQSRLNNSLKGIIYDKEKAIDFQLLTNGWVADVYFGKLKSYNKTQYWYVGLGNMIDEKEKRLSTEFRSLGLGFGPRRYRYGKQNYLYTLQGGWGVKRYLTEKAEKKGVGLAINYSGGLSAGLLIPYYLDVSDPQKKGNSSIIRYSKETAYLFLNKDAIRGKAGVWKGVSEATVVPGVYFQTGVHLDWGAFDEYLKAVEIGVQLQVFQRRMPILVNEYSKPYFFNLYVSLQFGKRY
jgi:hypothetical protein